MSWNYRVVRRVYGADLGYLVPEVGYEVREVYYDEGGRPSRVTALTVSPYGETLGELVRDLSRFLRAFTKPVLDFDDIGA